MRSTKFFVILILTTCFLFVIDAQGAPAPTAPAPFCATAQEPPVYEDCTDSLKPAFEWTLENSFGPRKTSGNHKKYVEIDMHRALYIEKPSSGDLDIMFRSPEQCNMVYMKKLSPPKISVPQSFTAVLNTEKYSTKKVPKAETEIIAVFDPQCRIFVEYDAIKGIGYHIFQSGFESEKFAKEFHDSTKDQGSFIFSRHKAENEGNLNSKVLEYNKFFEEPERNQQGTACYYKCKFGNWFTFETVEGFDFANVFKLSAECSWMTVYLNDKNLHEHAEISLRHGFVTLPREVKATPMDFSKIGDDGYEVTVAFWLTSKGGSAYEAHMLVANSHGRAHRTDFLSSSTKKIMFGFSDDTCLTDVIGTAPEVDEADKKDKLEKFEFLKKTNLGFRVATVPNEKYVAMRYAKNPDLDGEKEYKNVQNVFDTTDGIYDDTIRIATYEEGAVEATTTARPININLTSEVEPEIKYDELTEEQSKQIEADRKKQEAAIASALKSVHYRYWGIPAGFGAGSLGSFFICNIILFIFKRTIFTFWYKSMYKRYGSDTTMGAGTTMGKTMGGETVGGGTTMGGTTAGETTVGSTTAA